MTLEDAEDALQRRRSATTRPATSTTTHLGVDQGDARLGPRRVAVLPRGDARGRRGPALHRAADDRSWPPRTSATPTRRRSSVAVAAAHAVEHVGMPEGQFALAQAAIYLALAPKSERGEAGDRRRARARPRARRRAAARRAALGRLSRRARTRPRRGLRLPARRARATSRQELMPAGREDPLLRARRCRGRAGGAPGRDPAGARTRALMSALYDRYRALVRRDPRGGAADRGGARLRAGRRTDGAERRRGTGAYEPRDREVTAVEPSRRDAGTAPAGGGAVRRRQGRGAAVANPPFDAGMAVLSDHHWDGPARRDCVSCAGWPVARWCSSGTPRTADAFWLARDYLPPSQREKVSWPVRTALGATDEVAGAHPPRLP